jgi:LiaF transmembrane domain
VDNVSQQNPAPGLPDSPPAAAPPAAATPAPPAPPGAYATRDEWRAWRRQERAYYRTHMHAYFAPWGWFWPLALIVVGACFLVVNLGWLTSATWDIVWPALLILLGVLFLISRLRPSQP